MKVEFGKKTDKSTAGEMFGGSGEMGALVGEMLTEPAKLKDFDFPDDVIARANSIKAALKDEEPNIAVVRVEEGWSGSGRLWPAREINRIVQQTNELEPVGHLGHIPDDEEATSMPEPQTTWVGAFARDEPSQDKKRAGEMVRTAYFAGYNHPGAKIRNIIKARACRGISWWGHAHHVPIPGKGVEMREFDLKALDWARKLAEGMPTSSIVAIASEMNGGTMDKDLASVTPAEFKEHNPNGYALLRKEVEDEHKIVVGEMEEKITAGEDAKSKLAEVRKLLKLDEGADVLTNIANLMQRLGDRAQSFVKDELTALLAEKFPGEENQAKRELVTRLLPVGEMEAKVSEQSDDEAAKKLVSEMVNTAIDGDEQIKTLIGEQQPPVVRRREELRDNTGLVNNDYVGEVETRSVTA